jgi:uncharacterized membrane protein YhiD involved in acid resistance
MNRALLWGKQVWFCDVSSRMRRRSTLLGAGRVVSGIGVIGAGLVFVRCNKVRGLTTAASIWLTAAIGPAAGAGLIIPAVFVAVGTSSSRSCTR